MNSRLMDGRQKISELMCSLISGNYFRPSIHSFIRVFFNSFVCSCIYGQSTDLLISSFIDFPIHLFFGSYIHSLTHPFIHSLVLSSNYFFHSTIGIQDSAVSSLLIPIHVHVLFHINRVLITQSLSADGHVSLISKCVISTLFTHFVILILLL